MGALAMPADETRKPIRPTGGVPKGYRSPKVRATQSERRFWVAVLLRRLNSADEIAREMSKSPTRGKVSRATIIRDLRFLVDEGVAVRIRIGKFWKWFHVDNAPQARHFPSHGFERVPNGKEKRKRHWRRRRLLARLREEKGEIFVDALAAVCENG